MLTVRRGDVYEYLEERTGLQCVSMTQVRRAMFDHYAAVPQHYLEAARKRGELLHVRFGLVLAAREGLCPHPEPLPMLEGYCQAMDCWADQAKARPIRIEEPSLNRKLRVAGCPDALCLCGSSEVLTLLDLKSGEPTKTDAIQLVGYHTFEDYEDAKDLIDLYIQPDGMYKAVRRRRRAADWAIFVSTAHWLHAITTWRTHS